MRRPLTLDDLSRLVRTLSDLAEELDDLDLRYEAYQTREIRDTLSDRADKLRDQIHNKGG